jgi:hypothetical protein
MAASAKPTGPGLIVSGSKTASAAATVSISVARPARP